MQSQDEIANPRMQFEVRQLRWTRLNRQLDTGRFRLTPHPKWCEPGRFWHRAGKVPTREGGRGSEDDEVVAVDDLSLVRRPEVAGQVARRLPEQAGQLDAA